MSNSKRWKATTPESFKSIYYSQGDLGFFAYNKKSYGQFFVAVNTFTKKVFACPIKNTKTATLLEAIGQMKKVIKNFKRRSGLYVFMGSIA